MTESAIKDVAILAESERDALFRLITEEIYDLNEEDKLQGWTPWILSATLISMAWIVVQDVWNKQANISSIHAVFLVAMFGVFLLTFIRAIVKDPDAKGPFLILHSSVSAFGLLCLSLVMGLLAIVCFRFDGAHYLVLFTGGVFAVFALISLITVIAISIRIPLPVATKSRGSHRVFSLMMGIVLFTDIVTITRSSAFAEAQVSDLRTGGLLALGAYALILLSKGGSRSVEKRVLIEFRRELMLGDLSVDEARHRARVALQGLGFSDVFRDDMRTLLNLISEVRTLYADAFRKIDTLKESVPITSDSGPATGFEKEAVANMLDVLESYEKRVHGISENYHSKLGKMQFRAQLTSRIAKGAAPDHSQLLAEIRRAQAPADEDLERFEHEYYEIQSAWNRWYPSEKREHIMKVGP